MHEVGGEHPTAHVHDEQFLGEAVPFVHIVKLQVALVHSQVAYLVRIALAVVHIVGLYHALHRKIDRFVGGIGIEGHRFLKMSQHAGIVGERDAELVA